jgi:hypothetical protein
MVGAEEAFGAFLGNGFDGIDEFLAFIIAFARVALGVFVGENRPRRFQHRI